MQPSELFRRGIIIPRDAHAEEALRQSDVYEASNVRFLAIPTDSLFSSLSHYGLFESINRHCGSIVDDHEQDLIEPTSIKGVLTAIDETMGHVPPVAATELSFLRALRALVEEAILSSRPLLFVL